MDDSYFKQCLDSLQKSGEAARSTIYTFVLVYGALLLWALNTVVWPAEQQRFGQIKGEVQTVLDCLYPKGGASSVSDGCETKITEHSVFARAIGAIKGDGDANQQAIVETLKEINKEYLNFLRSRIDRRPEQALLISMIQIITSSGTILRWKIRAPNYIKNPVNFISFYSKFVLFSLILSLPICVSSLVLYDWYHFGFGGSNVNSFVEFFRTYIKNFHDRQQSLVFFYKEPEYIGGMLTIPVTIWEAIILFSILTTLRRLFKASEAIRRAIHPSLTVEGATPPWP